jgi:hypothetical protein
MPIDGPALRTDLVGPARGITAPDLLLGCLLVTPSALQWRADARFSLLCRDHPRALLPRRLMPDVLTMPTFEQGHPLPHVVPVEGDDGPLHG